MSPSRRPPVAEAEGRAGLVQRVKHAVGLDDGPGGIGPPPASPPPAVDDQAGGPPSPDASRLATEAARARDDARRAEDGSGSGRGGGGRAGSGGGGRGGPCRRRGAAARDGRGEGRGGGAAPTGSPPPPTTTTTAARRRSGRRRGRAPDPTSGCGVPRWGDRRDPVAAAPSAGSAGSGFPSCATPVRGRRGTPPARRRRLPPGRGGARRRRPRPGRAGPARGRGGAAPRGGGPGRGGGGGRAHPSCGRPGRPPGDRPTRHPSADALLAEARRRPDRDGSDGRAPGPSGTGPGRTPVRCCPARPAPAPARSHPRSRAAASSRATSSAGTAVRATTPSAASADAAAPPWPRPRWPAPPGGVASCPAAAARSSPPVSARAGETGRGPGSGQPRKAGRRVKLLVVGCVATVVALTAFGPLRGPYDRVADRVRGVVAPEFEPVRPTTITASSEIRRAPRRPRRRPREEHVLVRGGRRCRRGPDARPHVRRAHRHRQGRDHLGRRGRRLRGPAPAGGPADRGRRGRRARQRVDHPRGHPGLPALRLRGLGGAPPRDPHRVGLPVVTGRRGLLPDRGRAVPARRPDAPDQRPSSASIATCPDRARDAAARSPWASRTSTSRSHSASR